MKNDEILQIITRLNEEKAIAQRCTKSIKRLDVGKIQSVKERKEELRTRTTLSNTYDETPSFRIMNFPVKAYKKRTACGKSGLTRRGNHSETQHRVD